MWGTGQRLADLSPQTLLVTALQDPLEQIRVIWQPLDGPPLSREDAREIRNNLAGFFQTLAEWQVDRAELAGLLAPLSDGEQPMPDDLITPAQASRMLGLSEKTLTGWRAKPDHPLKFLRISNRVRYRACDVKAFADQRMQPKTTSEA